MSRRTIGSQLCLQIVNMACFHYSLFLKVTQLLVNRTYIVKPLAHGAFVPIFDFFQPNTHNYIDL